MSKQTEALKLALEALEWSVEQGGGPECEHESGGAVCFCKENKAITALREALANEAIEQPAQQGCLRCNTPKKCALHGCSPLTWPAEQPAQQQEPVAKLGIYEHKCPNVTGHRGPSFVCQKAGHGVDQNSYCKDCTCPEAFKTFSQPVGHLRMGPRQDFVTTGAAGDLEINVWHPVYTSPPAQRKPLTDEAKAVIDAARAAMDDSVEAYDGFGGIKISSHLAASLSLCLDEYDRTIEAAHGIKENT